MYNITLLSQCLHEPSQTQISHKIQQKYPFFPTTHKKLKSRKSHSSKIERERSLLCVVEEDSGSIDKANNNQHDEENEEGNDSKSKKPSWVNITETRPPSFVFIYISRPLFLTSVATVSASFPAEAFVFEHEKDCDHHRYSHPYAADHNPPVKPVA